MATGRHGPRKEPEYRKNELVTGQRQQAVKTALPLPTALDSGSVAFLELLA